MIHVDLSRNLLKGLGFREGNTLLRSSQHPSNVCYEAKHLKETFHT